MSEASQQDADQAYRAARRKFAEDLNALYIRGGAPKLNQLERKSRGSFSDSSVSDWMKGKYFPAQEKTLVLVGLLALPEDSLADLQTHWKMRWQEVRALEQIAKASPPVAHDAIDGTGEAKPPVEAGATNATGEQVDPRVRTTVAKIVKVLWGSSSDPDEPEPADPEPNRARPAATVWFTVGIALAAALMASLVTGMVTDRVVSDRSASLLPQPSLPAPTALSILPSGFGTVSVVAASSQHILAAGGGDLGGQLMLWNVSNPRAVKALLPKPPDCGVGAVTTIAFSPDGSTMVIGGTTGKIAVWNVTSPADPAALGTSLTADVGPIASLAFSPDGRTLAIGGTHGLQLWSTSDLEHMTPSPSPTVPAASGAVRAVAFSPDGRMLAAGTDSGSIVLWNSTAPDTPDPLPTPEVSISPDLSNTPTTLDHVDAVAFSNDGSTLFVGDADGDVTTLGFSQSPISAIDTPWNSTGTGASAPVYSIAVSSDGDALALANGNNVEVYLQPGDAESASYPNFSPWDASLTYGGSPVESLTFIPDTDTLVSASANGLIRMWSVPYISPSNP